MHLCFTQLNANKKKEPILALLNARIQDFDILFIEEPNWSFIGKDGECTILGAVNHASTWTPISPIPSYPDSVALCIYTYVKIGINAEVTLWTDIESNHDIMVLDITLSGDETTTYIHIYNDPSLGCQQALWQIRHLNLPLNRQVVITGNSNIHHIQWLRGEPRGLTITDKIVEWLDEHNFILLNQKGHCTHFPHARDKNPSVIDLTWANIPAVQVDVTWEWALDNDLAVGSDHIGIRWKLTTGEAEIDNPMGVKYNMKNVKPQDWKEAFNNKVDAQMDKLSPLLDETWKLTCEELNAATEALTEAMGAATAKVAPI